MEPHCNVRTEFLIGGPLMLVNSTQSLILTAPADRPGARLGTTGFAARGNGSSLGGEPLDVSWTEVDGAEGFAADVSPDAAMPVQQSSAGSAARGFATLDRAQQYLLPSTLASAAKGTYLDVHA